MIENFPIEFVDNWINYLAIGATLVILSVVDGILVPKVKNSKQYRIRGSHLFIGRFSVLGLKFLELVISAVTAPFVESWFLSVFKQNSDVDLVSVLFFSISVSVGIVIVIRRYIGWNYTQFEKIFYPMIIVAGIFFMAEAFEIIDVIDWNYYFSLK